MNTHVKKKEYDENNYTLRTEAGKNYKLKRNGFITSKAGYLKVVKEGYVPSCPTGYLDLFLSCNLQESSQQASVCGLDTEEHCSWSMYSPGSVIQLSPMYPLQQNFLEA